jgi:hypothetical protein
MDPTDECICLLAEPATEQATAHAHAAGKHVHLLAEDGRTTCLYDDPECGPELVGRFMRGIIDHPD